jgi:MFS family permease
MLLQSMFALGAIIGLLSVPIIGDVKGKRISISLCLLCMVLGNFSIFIGILYKIYFLIGIGQIFSAFGAASVAIVSYSISSDFFSDNLRQKSVMFYFAAWYEINHVIGD